MPSLKQAIARSMESTVRSFRKTSISAGMAVSLGQYPLTVKYLGQCAFFNGIQLITKKLRRMMPTYVTIFVVWITEKCNMHSVFHVFCWFMHLEIDRFQARRWWRMHIHRNLRAI